ncbi:MAG TPA: dienelactone hydrolase family protein [Candidatus Limnocylindrales bacterium]|nr:dienelactone hydrolase family protein [Candidatus Limnocylindrales bacterium]
MARISDVTIPLTDGSRLPAALALPDAAAPVVEGDREAAQADRGTGLGRPLSRRPGVIVIHEAIGLNDDIRRIASRFADSGYVTLAPDFLAGLGPMPFCIARFVRGIDRVGRGRPYKQLAAAQEWLARRDDVTGSAIGVAGFCMGGGFALLYAVDADLEVVAPFYAAVPDDPEALRGICPVVASYGGRDGAFGSHGARLDRALDELGVDHDVRTYPEAGHSFMSVHRGVMGAIERRTPTHGGYVESAAEDAWQRTLAFFGRHLHAGRPA